MKDFSINPEDEERADGDGELNVGDVEDSDEDLEDQELGIIEEDVDGYDNELEGDELSENLSNEEGLEGGDGENGTQNVKHLQNKDNGHFDIEEEDGLGIESIDGFW